eukprot:1092308-Amphidinium_carterae.1
MNGAITDREGKTHSASFTAPLLEQSNVPALLGLRSLRAKRAVLDRGNNVLYFPGMVEIDIRVSPGTLAFELTESPSGHLLLPFGRFGQKGERRENSIAFQANSLDLEGQGDMMTRNGRWRSADMHNDKQQVNQHDKQQVNQHDKKQVNFHDPHDKVFNFHDPHDKQQANFHDPHDKQQ